jgi:carboxyl-terminal processing protease
MVDANTTADDLWDILSEMIAPLNDGHTLMIDWEGQRITESRPRSMTPSFWMIENLEAYIGTLAAVLDGFSVEENFTGNDRILFGTIDNRIGYLNILAFDGYGEIDMDTFSTLGALCTYENDRVIFDEIMDEIFSSFSDMEALVIDLRFNGGGDGDRVKELTGRLVSESRPLYYYQIRNGAHDEFDDPVFVYAKPEGVPFLDRPIVVLTSSNTISAGDIQAMVLKSLPNATVMGETTFGVFSEAIPRMLPNGWMFSLSPLRLYAPDGQIYEQQGISPDIEVLPDPDALMAGDDNMLEEALAHIESLLASE